MFAAGAGCPGHPAFAAKAHDHGVARLEVGIEAARITLQLEVPLEDLTGFERAPRTDAERAAVSAALAKLREVGKLVRIDGAAGCEPVSTELRASAWGVGPATATPAAVPGNHGGKQAEHGDLEARYEFKCSTGAKAGHLELGFFDAFARLERIEVQAVTPRGQMKVVLRRPQARVLLAR